MCYYCKQTIRADICAQGYCGLGSTVKTLGLGSDEPVEVDYIVGYTRTQNRVHVGPDKVLHSAHPSVPSKTISWLPYTTPAKVCVPHLVAVDLGGC